MNGCHAVRHQYQPNGNPNRRSIGQSWEIASSDGCRFRDGKHASISLMLHRLLPEQLGLIPAPATTG
jgi:hypothetical protein